MSLWEETKLFIKAMAKLYIFILIFQIGVLVGEKTCACGGEEVEPIKINVTEAV